MPRYPRNSQSFEDHAAALVYLLNILQDKDKNNVEGGNIILQRYIIARSFPKMARRFFDRHLSQPFLSQLLSITSPGPVDKCVPKKGNAMLTSHDKAFLRMLRRDITSTIVTTHGIQIPHLMAMAMASPGMVTTVWDVYNPGTFHEFHNLLCALLGGYMSSLKYLQELRQRPSKASTEPEVIADEPRFRIGVDSTLRYSMVLHALAKSSIFKKHLETIRFLLPYYRINGGDKEEDRVDEDSNDEEEDGDGEEEDGNVEGEDAEDVDLKSLQPMTPVDGTRPISWPTSYTRWLQLQMSYMESIRILGRLRNKFTTTTGDMAVVRVIATPPAGDEMRTWKEVVKEVMAAGGSANLTATDSNKITGDDVINVITELTTCNTRFFRHAFSDGSPLSKGKGFRGTRHTEADLMGLLYASPEYPLSDDIRTELNVRSSFKIFT